MIVEHAHALQAELVDLRRRLHRIPEVGLELPATQQLLTEQLADLPVELHRGTRLSSLVAVLHGTNPGPVVLLRADMDALPLSERTGLDYAADAAAMHACGHDLHMAALVGAARLLAERTAELHGTVVLAFQPGEEGHGGALAMLDEDLLDIAGDRPTAAYALHVIADLPHGVVHCRPGPTMAGYAILDVEIIGRGAHGGRPYEGADPVPVAAECITALHTYVDRRFDPFDPVVVTVGELHAAGAPNVVAETVSMRVGVRTFSEHASSRTAKELPRLLEGIAAAHGMSATIARRPVMGPTINHPESAATVATLAREMFGPDRFVELAHPRTGSEDFSEILRRVPGAFAYLGAARPGIEYPAGNHSPHALFDDAVLADGAALLAALALHHLAPAPPSRTPRRSVPTRTRPIPARSPQKGNDDHQP